MDPIQTLGTVLNKNGDYPRDAIHIAVMSVIIDDDRLYRGQPVKFCPDSKDRVREVTSYAEKGIGIIDPFLNQFASLKKGDKVWVLLYPNTVKGMRHHWHHPDIDDRDVVTNKSELWLRNFADKYGMNYPEMITAARSSDNDETYITANARDLHGPDELDEGDEILFWEHMEAYTGLKFDKGHRAKIAWSCSC